MSEVWQFLLAGCVGLIVAGLWLFIIYLPRRTAEGEGDNAARLEDPEERD